MKIQVILSVFLLSFPFFSNAQLLSGKVTDENGRPLQNANILNQRSGAHAHANEIGEFTLKSVETGDPIEVSHLGFATRVITLTEADLEKVLSVQLEKASVRLDQVSITSELNAVRHLTRLDLAVNPVNHSQEVLRTVPGLFIGQHAGGGKAEQIFLRGFDIDHGTDVNIQVDGVPVNMVSHAHGQGYADLHFLIPELIETVDFGKGPYYADQGNFTTAGYVNFRTKDRLNGSSISAEYGRFNTMRTVALLDLSEQSTRNSAYLAGEFLLTDGFFESPQDFNRMNLFGKYTALLGDNQRISVFGSHFQSKWDASGQIPQRAVDDGSITRFGAIDDTEGGSTSRTNLGLSHTRFIDNSSFVKSRVYFSHYDFELFSNFTFFLNDPVNGDQIRQREDRSLVGLESMYQKESLLAGSELKLQAGAGLRYDDVNGNELARTANRRDLLERLAYGNVDETNIYGFVNAEWESGNWLINAALRGDYFSFQYVDLLDSLYNSPAQDDGIVSPKFNVVYTLNPALQFYLKSGIGFHSNDTRVVIRDQGQTLPAAYGADLGAIWFPTPKIMLNTAFWYLFLEQEFVYVGDEGIVEPSGETRRLGIDFSARMELLDGLFANLDVNWTMPRAVTEPEDEAFYIPLAPTLTSVGGLTFQPNDRFSAALHYRYLGDRPANEDYSLTAEGYFVLDGNIQYQWKALQLFARFENLLDTEWDETVFETTSRLRAEAEEATEIHFTPGTPFSWRFGMRYLF
jgi:hypothetical protein